MLATITIYCSVKGTRKITNIYLVGKDEIKNSNENTVVVDITFVL